MSDRMLRVNSILREVIAEEIERMSDSRLELVSVTGVDTAPNLRSATVFIDVLSRDGADDALAALRGAAKRLQSVIGREVRMKYTPTLSFELDRGITGGERIDEILREIGEETSSGSEAAAGGSERSERRPLEQDSRGGESSEKTPSRPEGTAVAPPQGREET